MNKILTEDLTKLKNTLMLVEVKGENVKILSNCFFFIDNMLAEVQNGTYDKVWLADSTKESGN